MLKSLVENELFVDFNNPAVDFDSEGNPLTAEQVKFFKNSKCLDDTGDLLLLYHAANHENALFDKNLISNGAGIIFGKGFYFCADEELVTMYGKYIKKYYLNLINPYIFEEINTKKDALDNVATFISKVLIPNKYSVSKALQQKLEFELLENDGGLDTLIELTCGTEKIQDYFIKSGFDGIMNLDVLDFVAFEPDQIKLANNTNPEAATVA